MSHSPLPWKHNGCFNGMSSSIAFAIHDKDSKLVCQQADDDCLIAKPEFEEQHENFEFIVKAVNNYSNLATTLDAIMADCQAWLNEDTDMVAEDLVKCIHDACKKALLPLGHLAGLRQDGSQP